TSNITSYNVNVANALPVVSPISGTNQVIPGQVEAISAAFTDTGILDTHTASINWGDNNTTPGTVTESHGSGTASGSHTYAIPGIYTIALTVTDKDGGASTQTFVVTVTRSDFILNPTASGALNLSGGASINLPGVVVVDSSSNSALVVSGSASITATRIDVVGKVSASTTGTLSPTPHTGASPVPDPLAALAVPSAGPNQGVVNLGGSNSLTIDPGVYSRITVSGGARLTMNPGVYIITGGGFTASGGTVSGSGVMIYNAGSNFPNGGGNFSGVNVSGSASVTLTPPTSGPYTGVVIFQARDNTRTMA